MQDPRYEVENEEIQQLLRDIGRILRSVTPPGYGFTLLLFSYGEGGELFYMSSAMREDMIKTMQEFLEKTQKPVD